MYRVKNKDKYIERIVRHVGLLPRIINDNLSSLKDLITGLTLCFSPWRISVGFVVENMALKPVLFEFLSLVLFIIMPHCSTDIHSCIKNFINRLGSIAGSRRCRQIRH